MMGNKRKKHIIQKERESIRMEREEGGKEKRERKKGRKKGNGIERGRED